MEPFLTELAAPFEPVTDARAADLAAEHWGVPHPEVERLDTERDDTFRVRSSAGDFVLKIANPRDDALVVNLQTAAMAFVAEATPALPVQGIFPTLDGEFEPVTRIDDRDRVMRLLSWLPGDPLSSVTLSGSGLDALGDILGRTNAALADFRHPAAGRELAWDAARLPALRVLAAEFGTPESIAALDLFDERVEPRWSELPQQIIHNDLHPGNLLVDSFGGISGILDFGDVVQTARMLDLSVAASYLLFPGEHSLADIDRVAEAFQRHVRLEPLELELLPSLIAARFAQRILINRFLSHGSLAGDHTMTGSTEALRTLLETI